MLQPQKSQRSPVTIVVSHPRSYPQERAFVLDAVLAEGLGVPWISRPEERSDIELSLDDGGNSRVVVAESVFSHPERSWPDGLRFPVGPLPTVRGDWVRDAIGVDEVPVLFGRSEASGEWIEEAQGHFRLGIDVFGSAFVLLSRMEELRDPTRDTHDRFPASASLGHRLGFLDRPLVDEYVELLRAVLARAFPGLESTRPTFAEEPTHDIDFVDGRRLGVAQTIRSAGRNLVTDRAPLAACRRLASLPLRPIVGPRCDVFNTFAELMQLSEKNSLRSTFFFIAGRAPGGVDDDNYEIGEPWVRAVLKSIATRGHEIGLHGSYQSFRSTTQLGAELEALRLVLRSERIEPDRIGCRQHFLRFDPAATWQAQAEAGLAFDSSICFADALGFRSGTCRDHPAFDTRNRRRLSIRERPLTLMDTTLLDRAYLGLSPDDAGDRAERLKRSCRRVGGTFRLLWHNTMLVTPAQKALYRAILSC